MSTSLIKRRTSAPAQRLRTGSAQSFGPVAAPELTGDLERLRVEEQERIDRRRQEAIALLQELARFD